MKEYYLIWNGEVKTMFKNIGSLILKIDKLPLTSFKLAPLPRLLSGLQPARGVVWTHCFRHSHKFTQRTTPDLGGGVLLQYVQHTNTRSEKRWRKKKRVNHSRRRQWKAHFFLSTSERKKLRLVHLEKTSAGFGEGDPASARELRLLQEVGCKLRKLRNRVLDSWIELASPGL